ncbi:predicted protein [Naegleria gruberi]|uniref:Predicted protein n=1 Tax=Naegleria gruberi TaxID=5762 RepID=D2VN04_NAEGR|nr:uncharacterized protein NAEGRDRAFT_70326 [Naegleria gruberi]EFC41911.1 predicted protein [Naegleria gruberi]|eukprot:XP_002674655.1 predicted protein [Naegleria gruberi strain NEG-M]
MAPKKHSQQSGSSLESITKISPNVKRYSEIKGNSTSSNSNSKIGEYGVVFSQVKARKCIEDYKPQDELEKWLLKHNEKNLVLCLEHPTHVSQRGGHYHIIFRSQQMYNEYLSAWKKTILDKSKMYIEEMRTKHAFRLYVDIDLKVEIEKPCDIVELGWVDSIMQFTKQYFPKKDISMVLTQCHGKWEDAVTTTAKYKSGYRLYFHEIIVDYDTFCDYTHQLCMMIEEKFKTYEGKPTEWSFEDIIDLKTCNHPRCRLFGSSKFRRGEILPRVYEFFGLFSSETLNLDEERTRVLREDMNQLLELTSARVEDPFDE